MEKRKAKLNWLQKVVSNVLLVGIGLTSILFFAWLIKILFVAIF